MKQFKYLFIMLTGLFAACDYPGDDQSNLVYYDDYMDSSKFEYNGTWSIDEEEINDGQMFMDSTFFTLRLMPCEDLLTRMMPERKVENVGYADVFVIYDLATQSEQALYFNIRQSAIPVRAVIDGEERIVDIAIGRYHGLSTGATATYSKLSGVYKFVFPITGYDIYDTERETLLETADKTVELTFTTAKRVYK